MISKGVRARRVGRLRRNLQIVCSFMVSDCGLDFISMSNREVLLATSHVRALLKAELKSHEKEIQNAVVPLRASRVFKYEKLLSMLN